MGSLGILFALTSGLVWGAGDFTGGLATRRGGQFQVLAVSALAGIVLLALFALIAREPLPPLASAAWAGAGGAVGSLGLACLYRGLSLGSAATVAPTAAVVTAALPVVFGGITSGWPRNTQLSGFVLAMAGIWLVARTSGRDPMSGQALRLALTAGLAFGSFLILIAQVQAGLVFVPLAIGRTVTFAASLVMLASRRAPLPSIAAYPLAILAGVLDAGGNVFYLLARDLTRLDVAAVLASLYPVTTVMLARLYSKEQITATQWAGAVVCLGAVVLITI
ncbi:MAG: EamA family transporter [Luteitalea sp.]|nr:EamA family transporter [Luteitalea sp.]